MLVIKFIVLYSWRLETIDRRDYKADFICRKPTYSILTLLLSREWLTLGFVQRFQQAHELG